MCNLIIEKNLNEFVRNDLNKCCSKGLKEEVNEKIKQLLIEASKRSDKEGRKTILPRHT